MLEQCTRSLLEVLHSKQMRYNGVCAEGVFTHCQMSLGCFNSMSASSTERESGAEFLVVQEMGGRVYMDVSAAKSDVINVVVA